MAEEYVEYNKANWNERAVEVSFVMRHWQRAYMTDTSDISTQNRTTTASKACSKTHP